MNAVIFPICNINFSFILLFDRWPLEKSVARTLISCRFWVKPLGGSTGGKNDVYSISLATFRCKMKIPECPTIWRYNTLNRFPDLNFEHKIASTNINKKHTVGTPIKFTFLSLWNRNRWNPNGIVVNCVRKIALCTSYCRFIW